MELKGLERLGDNSESFDNKIALCKDCHSTKDYHTTKESNIKDQQLSILSSKINIEMNRLNNIIYKEENNAQILSFSKNNYSFATPENTGTGIAYKGLVIFDISVLNLTNLPIIVHDSFVLKQISDKAFEKILELYIKSEKQVIIAIDKKNSYTDETQKILDESVILNLGSNGNELFGKSWG